MKTVVQMIDTLTTWIGKMAGWLTLAMVLLTTYQVFTRKVLQENSIAMQEMVTYMHAAVFLLGSAYALRLDSHVRVDIFYREFSARKKALANLFGSVFFLLPFAGLVFYFGWNYAANSWQIHEGSSQAGGLNYVYVLKTLLPTFAGLLFIQGIAEIIRNGLIFFRPMLAKTEEAA